MREVGQGALVGIVAGCVAGVVGELGVLLVLALYPTDVAIVGFALLWSVVLGTVIGAFAGWRGLWVQPLRRGVVAAAPGFMAGAVAMTLQYLSA